MATRATTDSLLLSSCCPTCSHGSAPDRISGLGVHMVRRPCISNPDIASIFVLFADLFTTGFYGEHIKLSRLLTTFLWRSSVSISLPLLSSSLKRYYLAKYMSPGNNQSFQTQFTSILSMSTGRRVSIPPILSGLVDADRTLQPGRPSGQKLLLLYSTLCRGPHTTSLFSP